MFILAQMTFDINDRINETIDELYQTFQALIYHSTTIAFIILMIIIGYIFYKIDYIKNSEKGISSTLLRLVFPIFIFLSGLSIFATIFHPITWAIYSIVVGNTLIRLPKKHFEKFYKMIDGKFKKTMRTKHPD